MPAANSKILDQWRSFVTSLEGVFPGASPVIGNKQGTQRGPLRAQAAHCRPLPVRAPREREPGTSGPRSSTEGDSEAAPGAPGRGELASGRL